jgi:hypothetical protein
VPGYAVCSPTFASIATAFEVKSPSQHLEKALRNADGSFTFRVQEHAAGVLTSFDTRQACSKVFCTTQNVTGSHNSSYLQFETPLQPSTLQRTVNLTLTEGAFLESYNNTADPHLIWLPVPETARGSCSTIAVYAPTLAEDGPNKAWICGIQSAWLTSRMQVTASYANEVSGTVMIGGEVPAELIESDRYGDSWWPVFRTTSETTVSLDVDWAKLLTSSQVPTNDAGDSVATMNDIFNRIETLTRPQDGQCPEGCDYMAPTVLSDVLGTMVTTAMATHRIPSDPILSSSADAPGFTPVKLNYFGIGTGYSISIAPEIIATCILCIYCIYAISYATWSITSGVSSNSWDSLGELVALALNSKLPPQLKHTSAGIETVAVFREPVRIAENEDKSLELVFDNDEAGVGMHQRLVVNQKY